MSVLGQTMLPVRYVTDPLGARIGWSQAEGKTTITLGETIIAKVVPLIVGGRTNGTPGR
jgi:hypothetical protein